MYPKIQFTAKNWSDLHVCNFYSKVIFWIFCLRQYFLLFFAVFKLSMFHNNIVKISEKTEQVENYFSYRSLHNLPSFLLWEKMKIFDFLKIID